MGSSKLECFHSDNMGALENIRDAGCRVSTGTMHADILQVIHKVKTMWFQKMSFQYAWVKSHQEWVQEWGSMKLEQQLNVVYDELVGQALCQGLHKDVRLCGKTGKLPIGFCHSGWS